MAHDFVLHLSRDLGMNICNVSTSEDQCLLQNANVPGKLLCCAMFLTPAVRVLHRSHSRSYLQVLYMTGWAPHASQQQPSRRGSATVSFEDLQDALKEQSDKAGNAK